MDADYADQGGIFDQSASEIADVEAYAQKVLGSQPVSSKTPDNSSLVASLAGGFTSVGTTFFGSQTKGSKGIPGSEIALIGVAFVALIVVVLLVKK